MPGFVEIVHGLYGAWRLACLDRRGMEFFDRTPEGFWKSFFAAAIVLPGYAILATIDLIDQPTDSGFFRVILIHACAYSLSWTAYPLAVHMICGYIGRRSEFIGYIVAFNWAKVIQMAVYLPVVAVTVGGLLSIGAATALNGTVYILLLGYQWFVTRTGLSIESWGAAGLVLLDLIVGVTISALVLGMIR